MFDTAYGNFTRKKNILKNRKKKKKNRAAKKISNKGQLTGILTELPGNRNFFPVAGINSGQTGIMAGLEHDFKNSFQKSIKRTFKNWHFTT